MPTDPFAIPQVQTNALQRVGPVLNPVQGLRDIVAAYATIARMNRMASGGGRGGGGGASGVGNASKGRWVRLPNGQTVWVMGTTQNERDSEEAKIKADYARGVLAKDTKYQELTQGFDRLSVPGKRERMQQVREHMEAIAPTLGMDPQQSVMLGTAGIRENIAAREKAIKDVSFLDSTWDAIKRGASDLGRAITTIGASPQEKQAAARASNEEAQQAAANNAYLDEMNRRREEGRSTLGMALRPTGLGITLGESMAGLGGTLAAQGLGGLAGGAIGALAGPGGAVAGANIGRTIGQLAGAAAGGALASAPLSEYSNVRRIEASDLSDSDKLAAIEKSNAGLYGAAAGAIPLGPGAGLGMALRQIPRTAPYGLGTLSKLAAPAKTYTGGVIKGIAPNAIDAATLGAGFNVAGNYAYNQATGQAIPLTEGLGDAIMEGAILGLPMAFLGARGTAARRGVWDANQTARENRSAINNLNTQVSAAAPNQPRMLNDGLSLKQLMDGKIPSAITTRDNYNNAVNASFHDYATQYMYDKARRTYNSTIDTAVKDRAIASILEARESRTLNDELATLHDMTGPTSFKDQLFNTLTYIPPENRDRFLADITKNSSFTREQQRWASDFYKKMQDPNERKPLYAAQSIPEGIRVNGPQNFGPSIEHKFTNSEINAIRKNTKDAKTFTRELAAQIAGKPEGAAPNLFTQLENSSRLSGKQKQWVKNYREIYNGARERGTEGGRVEPTAGLGRDGQPGEREANLSNTDTNRPTAADTAPAVTTAANEPLARPAESGGTSEAGRNDGTGTPNPRPVETPEGTTIEQGTAGTETTNGEPGVSPATDVSAKSGAGAGSREPAAGAGDGGITDAANAGEQSVSHAVDNLVEQTETLADTATTFTGDKAMEAFNTWYESGHKNMYRPNYTKSPEAAWEKTVSIASKLATGKKLTKTEQQQYELLKKAGMDYKDIISPAEVEAARETVDKINDIGMNVNDTEMVEARENRQENLRDSLENPDKPLC